LLVYLAGKKQMRVFLSIFLKGFVVIWTSTVLAQEIVNETFIDEREQLILGKRLGGLSSEEIERVTRGSAAEGWSHIDRLVLMSVEEMHADSMIS